MMIRRSSSTMKRQLKRICRQKILAWFRHQVGELRSQGLPEKQIKRKLLVAIRSIKVYFLLIKPKQIPYQTYISIGL